MRWKTMLGVMIAAAVCAAGSAGARAQDEAPAEPPAPPTTVAAATPDTPAGEHLAWFLHALAQTTPPSADEVERRFTPEFLAQVPTTNFIALTKGIRGQVGSVVLESVREDSAHQLVATLFSPKLNQPFALSIATEPDPPHRVHTLLMRPLPKRPQEGDTWDNIDDDLSEFAERVSIGAYRVREGGALQPIHMLHEREPLAIGSAFKLWILGALADAVREGRLRFDDPLPVRGEWKSLPSGRMQDEAPGATFPLAHYAAQMISISDNTATDHLLLLLGRERVEATMARFCARPERNRPMLTTRDMFALKLSPDAALTERYLAEDEAGRRAMLEGEVASIVPNLVMASFWVAPRMIDTLEWFASTEELCETIAHLARVGGEETMAPVMQALSLNPGVPLDRAVWAGFAYKGGSEPGVMNMTYWLLRHDGERFALSMTANDPNEAFDQTTMAGLVERAIALLARE